MRIDPAVYALADSGRPEDLKLALQHALEIEHATMPPYLYALFSLGRDNRNIARLLRQILREEMLHMLLAGNLLKAIGGSPQIDSALFVPSYPTALPGTVAGDLMVPLKPFSLDLVEQVFMRIEKPEALLDFEIQISAFELAPAKTIGEFYGRIRQVFEEHGDAIIVDTSGLGQPITEDFDVEQRITTAQAAIDAIDLIVEQGEGTASDPFFPDGDDRPDNDRLAHYYRFAELVNGRLKRNPNATPATPPEGRYFYDSADRVEFDASLVLPLAENPSRDQYPAGSAASDANLHFNRAYTKVLRLLHQAFNTNPSRLEDAIEVMRDMRDAARGLVDLQIEGGMRAGPTFTYISEIENVAELMDQ